jgi:hypothetical protein
MATHTCDQRVRLFLIKKIITLEQAQHFRGHKKDIVIWLIVASVLAATAVSTIYRVLIIFQLFVISLFSLHNTSVGFHYILFIDQNRGTEKLP